MIPLSYEMMRLKSTPSIADRTAAFVDLLPISQYRTVGLSKCLSTMAATSSRVHGFEVSSNKRYALFTRYLSTVNQIRCSP